jgi:hypothetical protein
LTYATSFFQGAQALVVYVSPADCNVDLKHGSSNSSGFADGSRWGWASCTHMHTHTHAHANTHTHTQARPYRVIHLLAHAVVTGNGLRAALACVCVRVRACVCVRVCVCACVHAKNALSSGGVSLSHAGAPG